MSTTDIPSFLVQTGPAAYTLTLSASGADTLDLCEAKYAWRYVTGIEAAAARAGMNYGKAIHICLEYRYRHPELSLAEVEAAVVSLLEEHFAANPQPVSDSRGRPEWRTQARVLQAFAAYNREFPVEDFEVLGVEEPFEVELGSFQVAGEPTRQTDHMGWDTGLLIPSKPTSVTVKFRGIRDLRVKWHDQLWVVDTKSSTEWSDLKVSEGRSSFQFQGYAWAERELERQLLREWDRDRSRPVPLPVGGVSGNYVISREPYRDENRKPKANDLPRDQFHREPYVFSDAQLTEWREDALRVARDIWRHWQEGDWPRRRPACAHWGLCEYYRLCWETDPAYRLSAALSADYRPRTPSPFEEIESGGKERV